MDVRSLKYLVLSDIHLGHKVNKTENIIINLDLYFKENHKIFKDIDILFLAGDIFDRMVLTGSNELSLIMKWLIRIAKYCKMHKIKLRVLEGTGSHDYKQMRTPDSALTETFEEIDYKYISNLSIEIMEEYGLSILYIPDEVNHDSKKTYKEILELMKEKDMSSIDIIIMHGQFHYQLPMVTMAQSFDEDDMMKICNYFISPGHIHTSSVFGKIVVQGSFDRITHGQEEDKGGMLFTLYNEGESYYRFIKNKHSIIFNTININSNELTDILSMLAIEVKKYPPKSNFRLRFKSDNPAIQSLHTIKETFPLYNFKKDTTDDSKIDVLNNRNITEDKEENVAINITKENVTNLLLEDIALSDEEVMILKKEISIIL